MHEEYIDDESLAELCNHAMQILLWQLIQKSRVEELSSRLLSFLAPDIRELHENIELEGRCTLKTCSNYNVK